MNYSFSTSYTCKFINNVILVLKATDGAQFLFQGNEQYFEIEYANDDLTQTNCHISLL